MDKWTHGSDGQTRDEEDEPTRTDKEDEPTRTDKEDERTSNGYRTKTKRD